MEIFLASAAQSVTFIVSVGPPDCSVVIDLVVKIIRLSPAVMPILCGVLCRYEGTKRLIHSTRPHQIIRFAAAITIPVTNAAKQEKSRRSSNNALVIGITPVIAIGEVPGNRGQKVAFLQPLAGEGVKGSLKSPCAAKSSRSKTLRVSLIAQVVLR